MDRLTRKELKKDKFAQEVGQTVAFLEEHRKQLVRYGVIALAVVVLVAGLLYNNRRQHTLRQRELRAALTAMDAPVGPSPAPGVLTFSTLDEKNKAVDKALLDLATKYPGTDEGLIAQYYLGARAIDQGKLDQGAKLLSVVADSGSREYSSLAKFTIAQIDMAQGKTADAEKLLRALIANPTVLVSKEEATIALAKLLAPTKPEEARKLLEPLRSAKGSVGREASTVLAESSLKK